MSAAKRKITTEAVKALQPDGLFWDTEISGYGVRCQRLSKVYFVRYRIGGRKRQFTIGKHGSPWTPDTARKEARRVLGIVATGNDPAIDRDTEKSAATVHDLAGRFMAEHVSPKRKERTAIGYQDILDRLVLPKLGKLRVKDVQRSDIAKLHHSMRESPYQANRVLAVLSKMFSLAEGWGDRDEGTNPCRHIEKYREKARERFLTGEELAALGEALRQAEARAAEIETRRKEIDDLRPVVNAKATARNRDDRQAARNRIEALRDEIREIGYAPPPEAIAAIRLLIFTGARLSEILTLKWDYVSIERAEARLPDSKTGAKTIHLTPPALEVLQALPVVSGNPYVIPGAKPGAHFVNLKDPWGAIRRDAGLEDVRIHDLRHSFASIGAAAGMGLPIIGKMLGHTQPQTTQRYAHLSDDPVKAAASMVAGRIKASMTPDQGGEVVPLPSGKG
ncbi:MAG: tyrosine-type recombinase/integrase [Rhodospirillales bacterium]